MAKEARGEGRQLEESTQCLTSTKKADTCNLPEGTMARRCSSDRGRPRLLHLDVSSHPPTLHSLSALPTSVPSTLVASPITLAISPRSERLSDFTTHHSPPSAAPNDDDASPTTFSLRKYQTPRPILFSTALTLPTTPPRDHDRPPARTLPTALPRTPSHRPCAHTLP
uniref:Uncharacterized protein n=1 Tax=Haptolina brevifila TaxID=156173 RepID=A0A7S2ILC7_9EUKA